MIDISGKIFVAPMAGVGDAVFRRMCKEFGADICVSEMISADGLYYMNAKTKKMMMLQEWDRPGGVQIFGSNPDKMVDAAKQICEEINPDFIDINSGCPVSKVVSKNGGAALLRNPLLFGQIMQKTVRASSIPVFVKIRAGWDSQNFIEKEFGKIAENSGISAITIHARTKTMGYSGNAIWERIKILKESVTIPVIGNGDICCGKDAEEIYKQTFCDAIMIGRAALGNPFVFAEIKQHLNGGKPKIITLKEKISAAKKHLQYFEEFYGKNAVLSEMKKHLSWYIKGFDGSSQIRADIVKCKTVNEVRQIFKSYQLFH
ncbi:MAG: tRNA dihydrouridine synthase DusB [Chitinispirillales bacterium]|jgi:tRNA-dihydrouridine synthase B|nr:tRNA dihydrouridine synthase DusB [Chitinispirillales bacterium]